MAQLIKRYLFGGFPEALDIFVSSDLSTIKAGENWLDEVSDSLKSTQLLIVLVSPESLGRPWINFEAGAGWIREIPVIPVCHSGLTLIDLPIPLNLFQAIEINNIAHLLKLFDGVANLLEDNTPEIKYTEIISEVRTLEANYIENRRAVHKIKNPRILCGASKQYSQFGFDLDVAILESKFPGSVLVKNDLTSKSLINLLYDDDFDIIHLVLGVDHENGDLIFSTIDSNTDTGANAVDKISAKRFSNLLTESNTSLVVLATCDALLLAVEVSHIATMITSDTTIMTEEAIEWEDWFYGFLIRGKSVYEAYELTKIDNSAPMRLIRKKDVVFSFS